MNGMIVIAILPMAKIGKFLGGVSLARPCGG